MKLREKFCEILKSDERFYVIDNLKNPNIRKTFRKLFTQFIEDRNIYTHGALYYRFNDSKIMLKAICKSEGSYEFRIIDKKILKSYIDLYCFLDKTIKDMSELLRNRK